MSLKKSVLNKTLFCFKIEDNHPCLSRYKCDQPFASPQDDLDPTPAAALQAQDKFD